MPTGTPLYNGTFFDNAGYPGHVAELDVVVTDEGNDLLRYTYTLTHLADYQPAGIEPEKLITFGIGLIDGVVVSNVSSTTGWISAGPGFWYTQKGPNDDYPSGLGVGDSVSFAFTARPSLIVPSEAVTVNVGVLNDYHLPAVAPGLPADSSVDPYDGQEGGPEADDSGADDGGDCGDNQGAVTVKATKATNLDIYKEMADEPDQKMRDLFTRYSGTYGIDLFNDADARKATDNGKSYWAHITRDGTGAIVGAIQDQVRLSVENFANAQQKDKGSILQMVTQKVYEDGVLNKKKSKQFLETFQVDNKGRAVYLDVHGAKNTFIPPGGKDVKVVMTFKSGWGKFTGTPTDEGGDGVLVQALNDGQIDQSKIDWLGSTPLEYTVTITVDKNGNWTLNDTSIGLTASGGLTPP